MDPKTLVRLLLQALGESDSVDMVMEILFPSDLAEEDLMPVAPNQVPQQPQPIDQAQQDGATPPAPDQALAEAIADFKKAAYRAMKVEDAESAS